MTPSGGASIAGRFLALVVALIVITLIVVLWSQPLPNTSYFVPTGEYEGPIDPGPAEEAVTTTIERARTQQF